MYAEKRLPARCCFNHRHPLDSRALHEGEPNETRNRVTSALGEPVPQTIGLCMYGAQDPQTWPGDLCEDEIDAQRCPLFKPHQSKDEILAEFSRQLEDLDWVRDNMPRLYELLWVIDTETQFHKIPWWMRLWWRILRIRLEPVKSSSDITRYLQAPTGESDGLHGP
jgi:hypothetical protein